MLLCCFFIDTIDCEWWSPLGRDFDVNREMLEDRTTSWVVCVENCCWVIISYFGYIPTDIWVKSWLGITDTFYNSNKFEGPNYLAFRGNLFDYYDLLSPKGKI